MDRNHRLICVGIRIHRRRSRDTGRKISYYIVCSGPNACTIGSLITNDGRAAPNGQWRDGLVVRPSAIVTGWRCFRHPFDGHKRQRFRGDPRRGQRALHRRDHHEPRPQQGLDADGDIPRRRAGYRGQLIGSPRLSDDRRGGSDTMHDRLGYGLHDGVIPPGGHEQPHQQRRVTAGAGRLLMPATPAMPSGLVLT
jgi:hypothetical protein